LALAAVVAVAFLLVSGGSPSDPKTPPALPGMPPPFLTVAVLGDGDLTAGIDAYGDVVDLRVGPVGPALIDNPHKRQAAGTVPAATGVRPLVSVGGGPPLPLWRADSVRQRYLPGTNVLRTEARFGGSRVAIECAAAGGELGCVSRSGDGERHRPAVEVSFERNLLGGGRRLHLDDRRAPLILAEAARSDRRRLARAQRLGAEAPTWADRLYERSLLAMLALTDRRSGAVAAGARDGWAYVWPRDAGAVAISLAAAGYRQEARPVAGFLLGLDLDAAARFDGDGDPVEGRDAQGDAAGWTLAAARAAGVPARIPPFRWRDRADYQEKSPGDHLANALAARAPSAQCRFRCPYGDKSDTGRVLTREGNGGLDSAAAWAVRPFPRPELFPAARRTLLALRRAQTRRFGPGAGRFGLIPSEDWEEADPWTAPTAWTAWSLAALSHLDRDPPTAQRDRAAALRLLASLRRAATPAGLLPERVDAGNGIPRSTAPLAWSHAFAALALRELWPGPGPMLAP
jgi:hypothetical protein